MHIHSVLLIFLSSFWRGLTLVDGWFAHHSAYFEGGGGDCCQGGQLLPHEVRVSAIAAVLKWLIATKKKKKHGKCRDNMRMEDVEEEEVREGRGLQFDHPSALLGHLFKVCIV